jgi:hypothetical protein
VQPAADLALAAGAAGQEITDKLSGLVAGQRLLAEIQSLMPNGSYRALINQRSVTLALPFAAKTGDAIELEVTGERRQADPGGRCQGRFGKRQGEAEAAATSLSRTGQLISNLLGGARDAKGPVAAATERQSANRRQSTDWRPGSPAAAQAGDQRERHVLRIASGGMGRGALQQGATAAGAAGQAGPADAAAAGGNLSIGRTTSSSLHAPPSTRRRSSRRPAEMNASASPAAQLAQVVSPQTQVLVQQQLEAFATQNFSWQGRSGRVSRSSGRSRTRANGMADCGSRRKRKVADQAPSDASPTRRSRCPIAHPGQTAHARIQLEQAGLDLTSIGITAPPEMQPGSQGPG